MADPSLAETQSDDKNDNNEGPEICPYPGGKARSEVWKYFGFYKAKIGPPTKENLDMTHAVCRLCRKKYANKGSTFSLSFCFKNIWTQNVTIYLLDYKLLNILYLNRLKASSNCSFLKRLFRPRRSSVYEAFKKAGFKVF